MLRERSKNNKIITLEILLPVSAHTEGICDALTPFRTLIDAINIPSNPLGKLRPDALCFAHIIQERTGIETIPHFVARHFTSLGFESHLLGASALGIKNILCVTGDNPVEGRSSFELNSARLLEIARYLREGTTSARKTIKPIDFCLCTSFNPNVPNIKGEFVKSAMKCSSGAEFFFTQPVFDAPRFLGIIREFRQRYPEIKIIAGLSYLYTKKRAFALMKFLGIPYQYITRIEEGDETQLLLDIAEQLKDHVDGFYIIPIARYDQAMKLISKIKAMIGS
ncbi:methylenetetrahydrofolate reductase [candidate division WOR-3 bacterium]|nr:methylenetetrahydrofolate reductase [candidate division WOR-3 bacterium]